MEDWLQQVLNGSPDAATIEHLRRSFLTWHNSSTKGGYVSGKYRRSHSPSLTQCLGLPTKPEKARLRLRNTNLSQAAKILPVDQSNHAAVAKMLALEVRRFMHHRWLIWNRETTPPSNASDIERLIFMAAQHGGGVLPTTPRQYITIIYEK